LAAGGDHPFRGMRRQLGKATMFAFSPIRGVQVPLRERETWTLPIRATPEDWRDPRAPGAAPPSNARAVRHLLTRRRRPHTATRPSASAGTGEPQVAEPERPEHALVWSPRPKGRSLICRWRAGLRVYKACSADRSRARWWSSRPRQRSSAVTIRGAGREGGSGSHCGQPKRAAPITASSHSGTRL
jgi:hypothetical protein